MSYGFVIDNRRCIGCHACSTACKSENQVPLGVYRTWVKTVERGAYPDVTRSFQVTRCNHCANPPCVRICPTTAMYQRADGIVEFDSRSCIGCKSCVQACPYDAIYIDPDSGTAAKCHYCAHRIDVGLEPACVVVCPVHAIVAGDLDDPDSEIARLAQRARTTVRKPEQGTAPKLFYVDGDRIALDPGALEAEPPLLAAVEGRPELAPAAAPSQPAFRTARSGQKIRSPQPQGLPAGGPLTITNTRRADQIAQLAYDVRHDRVAWHWPVPAYLVTKAIASGVFLLLALAAIVGAVPFDPLAMAVAGGAALIFAAATAALLVADLERPERFLYVLLYPQRKSWLARGALILVGFSGVAALWWGLEGAGLLGWLAPPQWARLVLAVLALPLAVLAAIYTAFLFAQAEGRDLWQSPALPVHMLAAALAMGAGAILVAGVFVPLDAALLDVARRVLAAALVTTGAIILLGEIAIAPASALAARAANEMSHGRYRHLFWLGGVGVGHAVPLAILVLFPGAAAAAALCAAAGLYCYEHAFVMAPQQISNS